MVHYTCMSPDLYLRHDNDILESQYHNDHVLYDNVFIFQNTGKRKTESLGLPNVGFSCYRNCILQVRTRKNQHVENDLITFVLFRYL